MSLQEASNKEVRGAMSTHTRLSTWPVWADTLTALRRHSSALAERFRQENGTAKRLHLQPVADYFWEGSTHDYAEWREFPPLRLPWPRVWAEWQMPAGCRIGTIYQSAPVTQRLTGHPPEQGVLLTKLPSGVACECFAPARPDGPWVASFLYILKEGRVVETPIPGGYFAPRTPAPGLIAQAEASGMPLPRLLSIVELAWVKPLFLALGQEPHGDTARVAQGELQ
jgi:hypothetical protein